MTEMASVLRALDAMASRITVLERQNRFTAASDWMRANWWGFCSPTQPASRFVKVGGGVLWWWQSDTGSTRFRKLDDMPYDLADVSAFTQSEAYRWCVLQADVSGAGMVTLHLHEEATEFGTAEEAETDFWGNGPADDLWGSYIPLSVLVVRNDGNLGPTGAVVSLTLADTEKSYFLVRDFRPWIHLHASS